MENFTAKTFGNLNAHDYDEAHDPGTTDASVALIYELAAGGKVLELAIGTGRIALPLAAQGLDVSGIEASEQMVEKMREKPDGQSIPVVIGDMADVGIDGMFDHIFLIFNTFFNLPSQAEQIRCFTNVAKHLRPGGTFLLEAFVPDFTGFENNQRVQTKQLDMHNVWLEAATHDPIRQVFEFQRIRISQDGFKLVPLPMRYAWPSEIDLMAQLAGLTRQHRWGGWDKSKFTADSRYHVSVYEKPKL